MILELWKNLRLQNQLLIIQSSIVAIIFVILILSCLYLIGLFSDFIRQELLQQLVLNSMASTIQTAVIRMDSIGMVVYNQNQAENQYLKNLYEFQVKNNINIISQLDDCLYSPHSQQFYGSQFCYGLYGQDKNSLDSYQIHRFTALQNQFILLFQRKIIPAHYNIKFGKTIFFSQYEGKFIQQLDKQILVAIQNMEELQSATYFKRQLNYSGQVFLSLRALDNQIYIGSMLNQSENPYYKLTQEQLMFLDSGLILSDTKNLVNGMQFQNASALGFNSEQFQKIKNFANKNGTIKNECKFQFKIQILCLKNINKKQQLVFSKYLVKSGFYKMVLVDTIFLNQIENDFNQYLKQLIDDMFLKLGIQYMAAFIICIILQIAFIKKLNRPLEALQKIAQSHINNYQHTLQRIASIHQTQNQTQKLAEAFFNLINLNYNNKNNKQHQFLMEKSSEFQELKGTILRRQSQKIIIKMRRFILRKFEQVNIFN